MSLYSCHFSQLWKNCLVTVDQTWQVHRRINEIILYKLCIISFVNVFDDSILDCVSQRSRAYHTSDKVFFSVFVTVFNFLIRSINQQQKRWNRCRSLITKVILCPKKLYQNVITAVIEARSLFAYTCL